MCVSLSVLVPDNSNNNGTDSMPAFASFVLVSRSQRSAVNCCCCCCYLLNKIFVLPRTNTLSLALSLTLSCTHTEAHIGCLPTHSLSSLSPLHCVAVAAAAAAAAALASSSTLRCPHSHNNNNENECTTTCNNMHVHEPRQRRSAASLLLLCRCCGQSQSLAPIGDYALSLS